MKRAILAAFTSAILVFMASAARGPERLDGKSRPAAAKHAVACDGDDEMRETPEPRLRPAICIERATPSGASGLPAGYRLRRG